MAKTDSYVITAVIILIIIIVCFIFVEKFKPSIDPFTTKPTTSLTISSSGTSNFVRLYEDWDGKDLLFEMENSDPSDYKYFKDFFRGRVRAIDVNILADTKDSPPDRRVQIWAYYPGSNVASSLSMQYETNQFDMPEHRLNIYNGFVKLADVNPGQRSIVQVDIPVEKIFMLSRI